jgi:Kef-type K+ transport system membrane component KefB/nucleotide-binding universal stress UspA family protein
VSEAVSPIALLLLQIAVVLLAARTLARVLRRLGQPAVIGEIVAGIALGPSLLGLVWPSGMAALFPADSLDGLALVAQLGLVFFMFLVGLEFDPRLLQGRGRQSFLISQASIVAPFVLGLGLAYFLFPLLAPAEVRFLPFALFLGAAMSVTAFPVLARILAERGVLGTRMGAVALSCAAFGDVTAWCILAFVVSVARSSGAGSAITTTLLTAAFIAFNLFVVRPVLARLGPRQGQAIHADTVAISLLLVLFSAAATELIGIHALFGAFLLGAVMPRGGGVSAALTAKLEDFVLVVLLPLFFAYNGLRTEIGSLTSVQDWLSCLAIVVVACLGKFGGSALAARIFGFSWRESGALGVLMNTRGLMELIVLNVGLDLGVISPRLFTMMVVMALATTWLTTPLLERIYPRVMMLADGHEGPPIAVLVCVSDPAGVPPLLALARRLASGGKVAALHVRRSDRPSAYLRVDTKEEPLEVLSEAIVGGHLDVEVIGTIASEPARDIVRVARERRAGLVLLGMHRQLLVEGELGGVVGRVIREADVPVVVHLYTDAGLPAVVTLGAGETDPDVLRLVELLGLPVGGAEAADSLFVGRVDAAAPAGRATLLVSNRPASG